MLFKDTNPYHRSDETPLIISEGLHSLNDRIDGCKLLLRNHLQEYYIKFFYQIFQNKYDIYRNNDCIKKVL